MGNSKKSYTKVIDEKFIVPFANGGGIIKFEACEYENQVIKYNMVYINKNIFPNDNGRVYYPRKIKQHFKNPYS